ncbi:electron transport complex subunit RsxC [Halomonas salinarum]|uniref:electron transport complex subunit RsxC n=1 Tax=Halomonas salinarum TaxID=1158993 RepID=UPI00143B194F|nr:electron transport complex subunit RsxC [Halomonas salinarum]
MAKAFDFPGGIHPPARKTRSTRHPIATATLPTRVVLPLGQHVGQPAEPCVAVGDRVATGTLIARAQGLISADLHASISGEITAIESRRVPHPGGLSETCIVIEGDGIRDDWERLPALDWRHTDDATLHARLTASGVVGLGGAGFPTQVKARVRERHAIDTLVINAAECEPYISADDMTLREHATDVLEGARLMAHLSGAERIIIGIEDDKPDAAAALNAAIKAGNRDSLEITLKAFPARYPSGGEKQLIKRLLNREVPSRGLPADVGVLCHNPGTLRAVLQAVRDGRPMVSRIVTLTGEALARPANVEARLGTPMAELLTAAGLDEAKLARLVMGGPMMGMELAHLDLPLVKSSNCLIAASTDELPPPPVEQPCIRCGACEEACPASLLPQQLYWFAKSREHDKAELFNLFDCIECGACSFVCPSHIPLVDYYRAAKSDIRARAFEAQKAEHAKHRFEFRQARLAREAAEKDARRQARAQTNRRPKAESSKAAIKEPSTTSQTSSAASSPSANDADLKSLRIAHAAAKAAVRKAEKVLTRVSQSGGGQGQSQNADEIQDLEVQLATARENLAAIEARMAAAKEAAAEATSETSAKATSDSSSTDNQERSS